MCATPGPDEVVRTSSSPAAAGHPAVPGAFPTEFSGNIRTAAAFNEKSPYFGHASRFAQARTKLNAGPPQDPEEVAQVIVDAAYTESPSLRYVVGADGKLIAGVYKQLDFAGFEAAMRQTLDWHE